MKYTNNNVEFISVNNREIINENRNNSSFHPGVKLSSRVSATTSAQVALDKKELVFFAVPAQSLRENLEAWQEFVSPTAVFVSLIKFLNDNEIPVMIYYPVPLYKQEAFSNYVNCDFKIPNVEQLCKTVFSLPIHTEIENSNQEFIINKVKEFFNKI